MSSIRAYINMIEFTNKFLVFVRVGQLYPILYSNFILQERDCAVDYCAREWKCIRKKLLSGGRNTTRGRGNTVS